MLRAACTDNTRRGSPHEVQVELRARTQGCAVQRKAAQQQHNMILHHFHIVLSIIVSVNIFG